ncbi:leucine-rich repeat domain-containing protein [Candidatus Palauibacter sp.]|uniref:leucine-rich repeat domain-containing protein n=1 Tax=Candidatus Palauibacter sp. TaxID=3101350 RepID=UPI003B51BB5C
MIPPELGSLATLRELILAENELTGPIPPELGNLNRLRELNLSFQSLTGPIPPEFGDLTRLRELDLSNTELRGAIPPQLGNLGPLRKLRLGDARLTGTIPPTLGNLQSLDELDVSGNQLSGRIPRELGNLRSLRRLNFASNRLSGPIPPTLGKLGSLDSLSVQDNRLTGAVPSDLARLSQLVFMNLSSNAEMSGPLPLDLTTLSLRTLLVGGTGLCTLDTRFRTWLTRSYMPICPAGEGEAIAYLTQAAQPLAYGVPLVADERALLRVFVTAARTTSLRIPPVRATFYLNGLEVHAAEIPAGSAAISTRVDEGDLAASSNAEIPGEFIRPGLEMVIEIDPERTVPSALEIPQRIPDTGRLELDVREMPERDLTLIPFLWSKAPDSSIVNTVEAMATDPESHELLWATRTLLPVGDLRVTAHESVVTSSNDVIELLYETSVIRAIEGATGHYMGLFLHRPGLHRAGAAFVTGRSSVSVPHATTMAHELGHNMALYHAPCRVSGPPYAHRGGSIGLWGYDFRDGGRLIPPSTPDLMSYCSPAWISDFHFVEALDYRLAYEGAPAAAGAENVNPVRSLLVWGGADADGVPFLEPAFVVDAPEAIPAPGSVNELIGRSDDGGVLFSLSFDMPEIADGEGRAAFAFALPVEASWARELASITLRSPGGGVTLDAGTDRPMTILRDPVSGQVRAILRHTPPMAVPGSAADVGALAMERNLEALFSRGIPEAREWRH